MSEKEKREKKKNWIFGTIQKNACQWCIARVEIFKKILCVTPVA